MSLTDLKRTKPSILSDRETALTLEALIKALQEGEQGYRIAAAGSTIPDMQRSFAMESTTRAHFALELQTLARAFDAASEICPSVAGGLHRGGNEVKSAFTGKDDLTILLDCERGEDSALRVFREALGLALPDSIRPIIVRQAAEVHSAHDRIRARRDQLSAAWAR